MKFESEKAVLEEQKRVLFKDQICQRCKKAIAAKTEHYFIHGKVHDIQIHWRLHPDCYMAYKIIPIDPQQTLPC